MAKFGLDLHGVIDTYPEYFRDISRLMRRDGHEVHIITGSMDTSSLRDELSFYEISYDHLFSITDFHLNENTPVSFIDDKGNYWFKGETWDRTKADYCLEKEIDFHIDDSEDYGQYFETPYCWFNTNRAQFIWAWKESRGTFLKGNPEDSYSIILKALNLINEGDNK